MNSDKDKVDKKRHGKKRYFIETAPKPNIIGIIVEEYYKDKEKQEKKD